ncbi:STAS domain-containing protein [Streptomyces sp. CRN 30]|uniref:STAS domain-containing protein n=1 Tax=Streptomyces sp. CRN 30 TaxID=3075613 RepID=UPI002A81E762|nr:STAS domain-containing protein [Streptomyces sp. CRN 30]
MTREPPASATPSSPFPQLRVHETAGRTVVQLIGEIDFAVVLRVTAPLDTLTAGPRPDLVIDLGPVDFLDCSGLGLLCRVRRRTEERGGRLTLVCTDPGVLKLLRIVKLRTVFHVVDALDDALESRRPAS